MKVTTPKKQIFCQNKIIAWSHDSRFKTTRCLLEKYASSHSKFVDDGCGDGTFLHLVSDLFPEAFGTDISEQQINDCRKRFCQDSLFYFCLTDELNSQKYNSYFDIAVCLEVLEHCSTDKVEKFINNLKTLVKQSGLIIISVPIEIGLSLLIKQITRTVVGWLRQGDYDKSIEPYTIVELLKMILWQKSSSIERPIYGDDFSLSWT